jgi:ABC-type nickel/cobalt efflux system permease component RcnA
MFHARDFMKKHSTRPRAAAVLAATLMLLFIASAAFSHPLGNFTINHFARIEAGSNTVAIHYVVDMAEIPAFQELQKIKTNGNGDPSAEELETYAEQAAARLVEGILLEVDGARVSLNIRSSVATTPTGAGGLPTLRIECDFAGSFASAVGPHRVKFENINYRDRLGWREVVTVPAAGMSIYNSTAYGNGLTDALKAYPEDSLSAPLDERIAEFSFTSGTAPAGATALITRDGRIAVQSRDRLAELISVPELTPMVALFGLLIAAALGGVHALSPGHGKTVVGAYLVGSRGTARHAAFLGLTVTITHTLGVFALGLVTLFASQYIVPETLFPILSLISGGIVLTIGLSLFIRRLRASLTHSNHNSHHHDHSHEVHSHHHDHDHHDHSHHEHDHNADASLVHSHGGRTHTHLPPGADGSRITWRNLLALGISGGLLPCPSALVVMLSAISLHRVGYGLILVIAFSIGLAATLTAVGLMFVYAGRLMKRPLSGSRLVRVLPIASAFVIACAGAVICYEAIVSAGWNLAGLFGLFTNSVSNGSTLSTASVLMFGLVFGLKHAIEADHLAAVSTIVSQRKSILSSSIVGGLWGLGHTISLLIAGVAVLVLHVKIGEKTALALEFCVALMLIALGANALRRILRGGKLHIHSHHHGEHAHLHPHIHEPSVELSERTHHSLRTNARPILVGMVHGLAGSAALMLLVLSTVSSPVVGLLFIAVFGIGSISGMLMMSALVSLPLQFTANRFNRTHRAVQMLAAVFSLGLGMMMVYEIGFLEGLFG